MTRLVDFNPEQRLRSALEGCEDFEVVIHVCRYLRETLADYGDQGKVATKLVDIIEGVVS